MRLHDYLDYYARITPSLPMSVFGSETLSHADAARLFNRIFSELAGRAGEPDRIMIDATHLKAHRTAASLLKGGLFPDVLGAPRAD